MGTVAFPVKFGSVSFNAHVCRIPFKIDRAKLKDSQAVELLVHRRITGQIATADISQIDGTVQLKLFEDSDVRIKGTFDTKSLSITNKAFSSGATFTLADVDQQHAERLAGQTGIVMVNESNDLSLELGDAKADVTVTTEAKAKKSRKPASKKLAVSKAPKARASRKKAKAKK